MLSISSSSAFLVKVDTVLEFMITLSCQFMLGILTEERTVFWCVYTIIINHVWQSCKPKNVIQILKEDIIIISDFLLWFSLNGAGSFKANEHDKQD